MATGDYVCTTCGEADWGPRWNKAKPTQLAELTPAIVDQIEAAYKEFVAADPPNHVATTSNGRLKAVLAAVPRLIKEWRAMRDQLNKK